MQACRSPHKCHIVWHLHSGMHRIQNFERKWPMSLGFFFFWPFLFSFSYLFAAVIDLLQALACFPFKNFWESIIKTGIFCNGVATCSGRKLCSGFFTQISEHFPAYFRLRWVNHFDLGIIGKNFSSCSEVKCSWWQLWSQAMTSETEHRPRLIMGGYGRHGSQWINVSVLCKWGKWWHINSSTWGGLRSLPCFALHIIMMSLACACAHTHWKYGRFALILSSVSWKTYYNIILPL